jgi:hypothetical protein
LVQVHGLASQQHHLRKKTQQKYRSN